MSEQQMFEQAVAPLREPADPQPGPLAFDPLPDEPRTELGYARRLIEVYGHELRYVVPWRRWLAWDGTRWKADEDGQAPRRAKIIARRVTMAAVEGLEDAGSVRSARAMESARAVRAVLELAGTETEAALTPAQLDAGPFLLNTPSGTIDLRTWQRHEHDPADLITKITAASVRPDPPGELFSAFLERVQPDPVMRDYLARLTGLALAGHVAEHILPIFWGTGANGKSTYVEAVSAALGDYAAAADPGLLTARRDDAHPTGVADLFGRRLAVLHEADKGRRLAEATVKRLTGGDMIKARRMREDFWEFAPSHTFIMLTNHKPLVSGTDEAIWRRIQLVPWEVEIPAADQDPELGEKLKLELDAVLAFLIGGYGAYKAGGLATPAKVTTATAGYRAESDALARFIEQGCETGSALSCRSAGLFRTWCRWCEDEGEEHGTQTAFSNELANRGFDKEKTRTGALWRGIRPLPVAVPAGRVP